MKKRRLLSLALSGALALSLSSPALAAPGDDIAVQLDGKCLSFTDAAPQARDGRTFLPFRAVFEAMGATVGYDSATDSVFATRGDKTVTMTLGSTQATVRTGSFESALTMDVAPFAENDRTYVPVRFAAQALGCAVGWDQDDQTVILVDSETLAKEAMSGQQFALLDQFFGLRLKYNQGAWALQGGLVGQISAEGSTIPFSANFESLVADGNGVDLSIDLNMDLSEVAALYIENMGPAYSLSADAQEALKKELLPAYADRGMEMEMRGNMTNGPLYLYMGGALLEQSQIPENTWFSLDLGTLMAQGDMPMDLGGLASGSARLDLESLLPIAMGGLYLDDKDTAYSYALASARQTAANLADSAFVKKGDDYVLVLDRAQDSAVLNTTLVLNTKNNHVVGYSASFRAETEHPIQDGALPFNTIAFSVGLDEQEQMDCRVEITTGSGLSIYFDLDAAYTASSKAPQTTPPAGVQIRDFMELMTQAAAQA